MAMTYLIIAHLFADFILQSNRLITWKTKRITGVLTHVGIFAIVALLLLFPYLIFWETWAIVILVSIFHLIIDQTKINIALRFDTYALPFITDQMLHFLSLIIGGYYLNTLPLVLPKTGFFVSIYTNPTVISLILAFIFLAYIVNILFFQQDRSKAMNTSKIVSFVIIYIFYVAAALFMLQ
jgi:hypothetical protein